MNKHIGQSKKKQEHREGKKVNAVSSLVASIQGQVQKFGNEWLEKHNKLTVIVENIFKNAATEFGKIWGNQQAFAESLDHVDLNVLALAKLTEDAYVRLERLDAKTNRDSTNPTEEELIERAKVTYTQAMKEAFAFVLEQREKERAEKEAAIAAAEEAKTEAEVAEQALKQAESESIVDTTPGGQGVDIPEGAEVFGGA